MYEVYKLMTASTRIHMMQILHVFSLKLPKIHIKTSQCTNMLKVFQYMIFPETKISDGLLSPYSMLYEDFVMIFLHSAVSWICSSVSEKCQKSLNKSTS
jgi:hypothetical protein